MPILDYRLLTLIAANARKKQSKRHGLLKKIHFLCKKSTIMQKLLSLPPNLVSCFHELEKAGQDEWFCTADPAGNKLGSGGGTTWLLRQWRENRKKAHPIVPVYRCVPKKAACSFPKRRKKMSLLFRTPLHSIL